jgi:translation initiation factor 1
MRLLAGTPWDQPPKCVRCGEPRESCRCPKELKNLKAPGEQTAQVTVEKRKKGKLVTVIKGLSSTESDLAALLTQLQTTCGAGGSVQGDTIEVQGDHTERVRSRLAQLDYRVR